MNEPCEVCGTENGQHIGNLHRLDDRFAKLEDVIGRHLSYLRDRVDQLASGQPASAGEAKPKCMICGERAFVNRAGELPLCGAHAQKMHDWLREQASVCIDCGHIGAAHYEGGLCQGGACDCEGHRVSDYAGDDATVRDEPPAEQPSAAVDDGANCRFCGHYETRMVRAVELYAHCPSCGRAPHWVSAKPSEQPSRKAPSCATSDALFRCDECNRGSWSATDNEQFCRFPQPDGSKCDGVFRSKAEQPSRQETGGGETARDEGRFPTSVCDHGRDANCRWCFERDRAKAKAAEQVPCTTCGAPNCFFHAGRAALHQPAEPSGTTRARCVLPITEPPAPDIESVAINGYLCRRISGNWQRWGIVGDKSVWVAWAGPAEPSGTGQLPSAPPKGYCSRCKENVVIEGHECPPWRGVCACNAGDPVFHSHYREGAHRCARCGRCDAFRPVHPIAEPPALAVGTLSEAINALPEQVRRYVHDIEANCDPAGTIRDNVLLRDHLAAFEAKLAQAATKNEQYEKILSATKAEIADISDKIDVRTEQLLASESAALEKASKWKAEAEEVRNRWLEAEKKLGREVAANERARSRAKELAEVLGLSVQG